ADRPDRAIGRCDGRRILQRDPLYAQLVAPDAPGDLRSRPAALRRRPRDRAQRSLPRLPVESLAGAPAFAASTNARLAQRSSGASTTDGALGPVSAVRKAAATAGSSCTSMSLPAAPSLFQRSCHQAKPRTCGQRPPRRSASAASTHGAAAQRALLLVIPNSKMKSGLLAVAACSCGSMSSTSDRKVGQRSSFDRSEPYAEMPTQSTTSSPG